MEIKITKHENSYLFDVAQGDKYADSLSYEEMIGLVSALTISKTPGCLSWMKTKEAHEAWREALFFGTADNDPLATT